MTATPQRITLDPAAFMSAAPVAPGGNTPWAARYSGELRRVVHAHAERAPRNLQRHLGPSELGADCDRQVAGKMAGLPNTNHVADPWPSIVGTAVHAWLADAFMADNTRRNMFRWVAEQRVIPHPDHSGTADLYDAAEQAVVDHKVLGPTTLSKVKAAGGPPRKYRVQLHLYGRGYRNLGLPVRRVALAAYPRTEATLDGLYVWEEAHDARADALIEEVFAQTAYRGALASLIVSGQAKLSDIPARASDDECYFCPFYRPQMAHDPAALGSTNAGCPGTVGALP